MTDNKENNVLKWVDENYPFDDDGVKRFRCPVCGSVHYAVSSSFAITAETV